MPKPKITSLSVSYSVGMELEGNFAYSVSNDDDGYHLQASLNSGNIEIEKEISEGDYETLIRLFDDVDLTSWDDSDYDDREIALDAASFTFTASFSDGTMCVAHSLLHAPEGYPEVADAFESLFMQMIEKVETSDN